MIKITDKNDCIETINSIKRDVINTRHRIMRNANKELINLYYRIGKMIYEQGSYGKNFVGILSKSLKMDFPDSIGFSERNLWRMKAFYENYREYSILPPAVAELPWTLDIIDVPIGIASYNIINKNDILDKLPTEEDINTFISLNLNLEINKN